jgi:nicotinate phosphoribosyltransferase
MAPEAGVLAARAAYIGGCVGTSNVEADYRFGVPCLGTVGHSFVMAHSDEQQSFRDVSRIFPGDAVLLLDTYDTLAALKN